MVWPARARLVHAGRHTARYHPFVVVVICHSAIHSHHAAA